MEYKRIFVWSVFEIAVQSCPHYEIIFCQVIRLYFVGFFKDPVLFARSFQLALTSFNMQVQETVPSIVSWLCNSSHVANSLKFFLIIFFSPFSKKQFFKHIKSTCLCVQLPQESGYAFLWICVHVLQRLHRRSEWLYDNL